MQQQTEATVAAVAQKVSVGGGGFALFGGLSANELVAFGGLLVAVIGLAVQWYYKAKSDRRAELLHAARLSRIDAGEDEDG